MEAEKPKNEAERLAALRRYGVLDTEPEQVFDDLAMLASQVCATPMALVTFVDEERQWFKARVGLDERETPRSVAFCAHTILWPTDALVVRDATQDVRFADNPFVTNEPRIRFYAGIPLVTPEGLALGTLCTLDRVPRKLSKDQVAALAAIGRQVMSQLELRRRIRELEARLATEHP